jgi:hypothetical protein
MHILAWMYSQVEKYINKYVENYTELDTVHDFYRIKDINETRVNPMEQYTMATAEELGLKIGGIYSIINEPPIITLEVYYNDVSVIRGLWSRIRDKAIEYNVIVIVAKRLSSPEYKDEIDYYVRNRVVNNVSIFYKNGVNIGAIGFGYVRDAVWIGVNMTNSSREYVMKVVKLARQLVDDPKIPVVIQFKKLRGVSTLELRAKNNGNEYLNQQILLATSLIAVAISTAIIISRKLRK